jgi:hypothetical protein
MPTMAKGENLRLLFSLVMTRDSWIED